MLFVPLALFILKQKTANIIKPEINRQAINSLVRFVLMHNPANIIKQKISI